MIIMAATAAVITSKTPKSKKCSKNQRKYATIYYNDGSGDNIPAIVQAMRKMDINTPPLIKVK